MTALTPRCGARRSHELSIGAKGSTPFAPIAEVMSLLAALAANVNVSTQPFGERVEAVLERDGVADEPVVEAAASAPLPIEVPAPPPSPPSVLPDFPGHLWGAPFPVDHGGPTFAHHQECVRCGAVGRRVAGKKAGKGRTVLLPGTSAFCPGYD